MDSSGNIVREPAAAKSLIGWNPPLSFDRLLWIGALLAGGLAALGLTLFTLSRHNALYGLTEYDDGVYFASAVRFVHGQMPYRDFVFVQPPGITVLMSPIALLSNSIGVRDGLAAARILTAILTGANAVMVAWLLRFRGRLAMLVGGVAFGVFPPAFIADRTLELEPYLVFFCLIGLALLFQGETFASRRRIIAAGVAFGIAGSMKSFAILGVAAVVLVLLFSRRSEIIRFLLGVVVGFVAICGAFFIASPHGFFHDVISSQLGRQTLARATIPTRLGALTGLADAFNSIRHFGPHDDQPAIIGVITLAFIFFAAIVPAVIRKARPFEWFTFVAALFSVAAILIAASFYNHYTYFSEVFIAMAFGLGIANIRDGLSHLVTNRPPMLRRYGLAGLGVTFVLALSACSGLLIANESSYAASVIDKDGDPGPAIAASIPKGACAITDAASLLVAANRLESSDPNCPTVIDSTGTWIATDPNNPPLQCRCGPAEPALTAEWQTWLSQASYVIFSGVHTFRVPWTTELDQWFATHYKRVPNSGLPVFENIDRVPQPSTSKTK